MDRPNPSGKRVGIFWQIGPKRLIVSEPLESVPVTGGMQDSDANHSSYWQKLKRSRADLREYSYDYYPRGRVVFDAEKGSAIVYADCCLIRKPQVLNRIIGRFGLKPEECRILDDAHYRCHRCNKDYVSDM